MLGFAVELRSPRPLPAEERARVRRLVDGHLYVGTLLPSPEEKALERAGLLALAETVPSAYWKARGLGRFAGGAVEEEPKVVVFLHWFPPSLSKVPLPQLDAEGPRGRVYCTGDGVFAEARSVDDRFLELAARAKGAAERLVERYLDWLRLLNELRRAELDAAPFLSPRAPIAGAADPHGREPGAKVWEEGGKVKVWLSPEHEEQLKKGLAEAWRNPLSASPERKTIKGLDDYLRRLSERLGREVELVGEEPPFRWSPEVDEAMEELRRAMRELVGSA